MNRLPHQSTHGEHGSVAVEFAILLVFVLVPLLAGALFFGRFFWHYTVAEKAAHDAARFFASASATEMKVQAPGGGTYIAGAAKALAQAEIAELNPGSSYAEVYIWCDGGPCLGIKSAPLPQKVSVYIAMTVEDPFLQSLSSLFNGDGNALAIQIDATGNAYYVGN
jgi:hypothetical protein